MSMRYLVYLLASTLSLDVVVGGGHSQRSNDSLHNCNCLKDLGHVSHIFLLDFPYVEKRHTSLKRDPQSDFCFSINPVLFCIGKCLLN